MDLSIIITTFNYEQYIEKCISSCLNQTDHDLTYEIIVVDDGSEDNTSIILNNICDENVRVYKINNSGIEKASNFGLSVSSGKYVVRVDADDCLLPSFINSIQRFLGKGHAFIYSDYAVIDRVGELVQEIKLPKFDKNEIFQRGDFLATGTVYDTKFIDKNKFYNCNEINSGLENYELILKMICKNFTGFHIPLNLFNYRRHSQNLSSLKQKKIIANGKALFLREGWGSFTTNKYHPYGLKVSDR
jgi:glycosyltransferase involved in cell wall biosynthesis